MTTFEYWYFIFVIASCVVFAMIFIIIHSHVWVRGGYEGLNSKLELHEVDRFVAHVSSEFCLVVLYIVCMMEPLTYKFFGWLFPIESKIIFASGLLGSGLYIAFRNKVKGFLEDDKGKI